MSNFLKAFSVEELASEMRVALKEAEKTVSETLKKEWLLDASKIKAELSKRGENWLHHIRR